MLSNIRLLFCPALVLCVFLRCGYNLVKEWTFQKYIPITLLSSNQSQWSYQQGSRGMDCKKHGDCQSERT